jgi:hypothetical protein
LEEVKRDLTGQLSNVTELEHIVPTVLKILHNFRDGCVTILSFILAKLKMVKFEFSLSAVFGVASLEFLLKLSVGSIWCH